MLFSYGFDLYWFVIGQCMYDRKILYFLFGIETHSHDEMVSQKNRRVKMREKVHICHHCLIAGVAVFFSVGKIFCLNACFPEIKTVGCSVRDC